LNQSGDFNSPKYWNNYSDSKSNSNLIEIKSSIIKNKMNETKLSLETAIKLIPAFNGVDSTDVYPFFNACEFVMSNVDFAIKSVLL